ncbi:TFP11-domain-containing protein [Gymnopus androsaceus JB14]|uniref:TFP11-domain-containing protein n=1 Tax=Gymnopus androsaceus JB14 TaxID=1447944 RepID=A0A6A4GS65_9AGAR|nr:TFP11-domain-containing protein [Gymnopus androsaceus JB14]
MQILNLFTVIARLQQVQLVMMDIDAKVKVFSSDYDASLDNFSLLFYKLTTNFEAKFDCYQLDEVVVAAIAPLVQRMVAQWQLPEDPKVFVSTFRNWRCALRVNVDETPPETQVDIYGTKTLTAAPVQIQKPMTLFKSLLWNVWLPKVRTAINNEWSPKAPQPALKLYEAWSTFLPLFIRDNMLDQLILPKVQKAVADWNAKLDQVLLQTIVFPWLPHVGLFVGDARRKLKSLLRIWILLAQFTKPVEARLMAMVPAIASTMTENSCHIGQVRVDPKISSQILMFGTRHALPNHGNVSSPRLSSSAPKPMSNVTGNASVSLESDLAVVLDNTAQTAAVASTTTTTATAIRDKTLDIEVPTSDCASAVTPNPHCRTARAEFANCAINELCAERLVVKRILWHMDGMDGDGTLKMKGKGKKRALTEGETENAMTMVMNNLITMDNIEPSQCLPQVIQNTSPQFPSNTKMEVNDLDKAMEIIDLTVDEKSSPPPSYSYKFDDDEDDQPPFKPPLIVHLGSGRSLRLESAGLSTTTVRLSDSPSLLNSSTAEATSSPQLRAHTEPRHKSRLQSLPPRPSYSHLHSSPLPPSRGTATSDDGEAVEINQSDDESSSSLCQELRDTDEEMQVLDDLGPGNGNGNKDLDRFNTEMEMNDLRGIVESRNIYKNNRGAFRVGAYEAGMDTEDSELVMSSPQIPME